MKQNLVPIIRKDLSQLVVVLFSFVLMVAVGCLFAGNIVRKQLFDRTWEILQAADTWFTSIGLQPDPLFSYVQNLQTARGGYGILTDENFTVLIHPNRAIVGRPFAELGGGYAGMVQKLAGGSQEIVIQQAPNPRGFMMVLAAKRLSNGWYLTIVTRSSRYYGDVYSMAITLSALGLVFIAVLSAILIRLSISKARADEENKDKSSFLARMTHEIRTPLNSILGMAEIILRKKIPGEIQEYIGIIHQSGQTLLAIVNDVLDFSKIETGRLRIEQRTYPLAAAISDMINVIRPRAAEKSLDFFVNVESGIPAELEGDDTRIKQILINLLTNAVKYTRRGFISLDVGMEKLDAGSLKLTFTVKDSGIGIKAEDVKLLFNEFSRVDTKTNLGIEGTGLGLAITRSLCRAMGGDVSVSSVYESGSTFRADVIQGFTREKPIASVRGGEQKRVLFYDWRLEYVKSLGGVLAGLGVNFFCPPSFPDFKRALGQGDYQYALISSRFAAECIPILDKRLIPLELVVMVEIGEISVYRDATNIMMPVYSVSIAKVLNGEGEELPSAEKKPDISFIAPGARALIVDDISTNLRVAKELMAPYNMVTDTCMSGPEAVELVRKNRYDIVFMDHMMPGMDGLEATAFIRALDTGDGYYRKLPIVILTASAFPGQREMFLQKGLDDFLAKPIDLQKLNGILEKWLPPEKQLPLTGSLEEAELEEVEPEKAGESAIPGLDVEAGLRNSGGSPAVYQDILAEFCRDVEGRAPQITGALEAGDFKLYAILVHAVKGAARSIGAVEVGETAAWLEQASAKEDSALVKGKTGELLEKLKDLVGAIRAAAPAPEEGERLGIPALRLEELKAALEALDIETVNKMLVEYAELALDAEARDLVTALEEQILMFEYDKAVERIRELL